MQVDDKPVDDGSIDVKLIHEVHVSELTWQS